MSGANSGSKCQGLLPQQIKGHGPFRRNAIQEQKQEENVGDVFTAGAGTLRLRIEMSVF